MELAIYNRQGTLKRKVSPDSSSRWTEEVGTEFVAVSYTHLTLPTTERV